MNPLLIALGLMMFAGHRRAVRQAGANGPGVRLVPGNTPVRTTVHADQLGRHSAEQAKPQPAAAPRYASPIVTPAPGSAGPSAAERAQVEEAVKAAVAEFRREDQAKAAAQHAATPAAEHAPEAAPKQEEAPRTAAKRPAPTSTRRTATRAKPRRSPSEAARALFDFVNETGRFGSKTDRPQAIKDAQRDLGVAADGVVGPRTRAAAKRAGVTLPAN